ncbi:DNA-3-methyladenine glycosylase I [uncultured Ilyobacter sp.]|uniref:DNA-3-methyladenine glycosylase I n=1 Tax=uncultured Ilyobacter sp. TaxID=544433 RepID=UPI0029C7ED48|nr:DNA-3-methyladenine glycosylase I [uncultured Ilyobacter sp.]
MRCSWCGDTPLYIKYHDEEWGVPVYDDMIHFEFLVLESAQAGLSWLTVLKKRENYRKAYEGFDPKVVAGFDQDKVEELMQNEGIIRNRKKIEASINNARVFMDVQKEFGSFSNYIWSFVGGRQIVSSYEDIRELPAKTHQSEALAKDMKKRGFKFLGPVILYSHMQATGLVNDHIVSCFRHKEVSVSE